MKRTGIQDNSGGSMLSKLKKEGIVAVIRAKGHEEALGYVNACLNGGIKALELTYTIPNVVELIKEVKKNYFSYSHTSW